MRKLQLSDLNINNFKGGVSFPCRFIKSVSKGGGCAASHINAVLNQVKCVIRKNQAREDNESHLLRLLQLLIQGYFFNSLVRVTGECSLGKTPACRPAPSWPVLLWVSLTLMLFDMT